MSRSRTQWQIWTQWLLQGIKLANLQVNGQVSFSHPDGYRPSNLNPTIAKTGWLLFSEWAAVMSWQDWD